MDKIEKELTKALGDKFAAKKGEDRQKYLARLVRAINDADESVWTALSEDAQQWVNDAVDQIKAKKPIADFGKAAEDDDEDDEPKGKKSKESDEDDSDDEDDEKPKGKKSKDEDEDDEDEDDEDDEPKDKKKSKKGKDDEEDDDDEKPKGKDKKKSKKSDDDDDDEDDKPKKKKKAGKEGTSRALMRLIVKHPAWKKPELMEKLKSMGYAPLTDSTLQVFRAITLRVLHEVQEQGLLKKNLF